MNKIFLETYGCQMNVYDTELVKSILTKENYAFVPTEDEADVIMLNTCAIRENAHRKVYGRVNHILHKRKESRDGTQAARPVKIGILGCMATNLRTELLDNKQLKIDFIAGPDSYKRLPALIAESFNDTGKHFDVTLSEFETYSDIFPNQSSNANFSLSRKVNAWIAVMRGCNNFCSFCVVPYTRGRERSRSPQNVLEEVKKLADEGFKQITLLGQNVNSYSYENYDFAYLLDLISTVKGVERIRFTSPHPKDFPDNLLHVITDNPKICKHLHLPLQAGNTRILDLMNRTYTKEEFLALADKVRKIIPNATLTTDVIVGFSSETDAEFNDTFDVMQKVEFDSAFSFKYSERKNTIASKKFKDDVPEAIKTERIVRLNELQKSISLKKNKQHIGQIHTILIESESTARSDKYCQGRTDGNKIVVIPKRNCHSEAEGRRISKTRSFASAQDDRHEYRLGDMVSVQISDASPNSLKGTPVFVIPECFSRGSTDVKMDSRLRGNDK